uniref:ORC1/DEAH AAA+ ATPase domain-containing protein n=1 Tax=uncultured bacterium fosmid pJB16B1 TaxID=1478054 RepID=A0A0H3U7D7_9BACT|nr:hypothetical protein [uncultured bacterium fosmid pJB16B1]
MAQESSTLRGAPSRTDAQVRAVITQAVAMHRIDEDQGELLFWLHGFGQDRNLPDSDLAEMMKVSNGAVSQLFSGKYQAEDWTPMIDRIKALKDVEEEALKKVDLGFVMTHTAKTIFSVCESAMTDGMPAFIYGASQIGKTTALEEFQRTHNHGRTKYLRLGSRWTKGRLVRELARACKARNMKDKKSWQLEEAIYDSLNRYNLLIIDEFHLAMETVNDSTSREIVEFIREVFDRTHCGLVLSSTKVGIQDLEEGKNAMLFDQLRRRGVVKVVLPDVPPLKDINAIAKSFGLELPKAEVLAKVKQLLKTRGLGVFVKYLQKAHSLAGSEPMTWERFFYVNDGYAALADMKSEY